MYTVYFTADESCILAMYKSDTVAEAIGKIKEVLPDIEDSNMRDLLNSVLTKLNLITDEDYAKLDFSSYEEQIDGTVYEEDDENTASAGVGEI